MMAMFVVGTLCACGNKEVEPVQTPTVSSESVEIPKTDETKGAAETPTQKDKMSNDKNNAVQQSTPKNNKTNSNVEPTQKPTATQKADNSEKIAQLRAQKADYQSQLNSYESSLSSAKSKLTKAESDLVAAKNKKVKVYREGQGFVYEVDEAAVSSAQSKVNSAKSEVSSYQKKCNDLKSKISSIDKQIASLQ